MTAKDQSSGAHWRV